ncbi:DegT/DnrJ/EryC1/StrS family aminotransferase [Beduinella massiliensis]|uniref:DegT/DnrJ/EryC1/StrS family aminotransferase n=1 Tax=Beduinella massiliensis TaxID=1852363 RepID=UPI000C82B8BF
MSDAIYVTRPFLPEKEEFFSYVDKIWKSRILTNNGPLHQELEQKIQQYLRAEQFCLFVNGHSALRVLLQAMELRGEIITTPFTFVSTVHAISEVGCTPVFGDIRWKDLTLDPESVEALITEKTCAILAVHVYGFPCDVEALGAIGKKHGIPVIYDAAHTFGAKLNGEALCNYGDGSILSFHATKLYNSIEGGAAILHREDMVKKANQLKNFGIRDEENIDVVGGNAKMNEFQAAMGLCNLNHIDEIILRRRNVTLKYRECLKKIPGIRFFVPEDWGVEYNYAYMPVEIDETVYGHTRDELYVWMKENQVFCRKYFYPLLSDCACYKDARRAQLPIASVLARKVLCLPIYDGLSHEQVERICNLIECIPE